MPKWAYGFWQSRQRYETQEQLLDVMREYRKRRIQIDNIVQDWFYWPENAWGSHDFDKTRFPDATAMVDEVHADRKRVVEGKRGLVRVDIGGCRIINNKKNK